VAGAVEDLAPLLLGRDPRDIEQLVWVMKKQSFWRLGVIGMSAVSGIELARWGILGKSLGVPI
jgi:galactonate dehydratase